MQKDEEVVDTKSRAYASLANVLRQALPDAEQRVKKSVAQWNNIVRDYLRHETGLRLSVGNDVVGVPIHYVDGLPAPFSQAVAEITDPLEWQLILSEGLLNTTSRGLDFLVEYVDQRDRQEQQGTLFIRQEESVETTRNLVRSLLDKLKARQLHQKLKTIQTDVLGAYFFSHVPRPEIHLYWMVIGAVAAMLDVSIESLTVVVLTHELSHAYTHQGRDIDGHRWETPRFAETDRYILEGLAQYYTELICQERLASRYPSAAKAYSALLAMQSEPYQAHEQWAEHSPLRGEAIRAVMILTRSTGIWEYQQFQANLHRYVQELTSGMPLFPSAATQ